MTRRRPDEKTADMAVEFRVDKRDWTEGLFCVGCGKRIPFGRSAFWIGQEAYGQECVKT